MKDLILVGSSGCMQELLWQIEELNKSHKKWNVIGYVDQKPSREVIDVGYGVCDYLGDDEYLLQLKEIANVAVCIGNPDLRKRVVNKLKRNPLLTFPVIILSDVKICPNVKMKEGCIISMNSVVSTDVELGSFVFLNMGVTICHQSKVGDYSTVSPTAVLAGNVKVGESCNIGVGTKIIQGISIGGHTTIGAGSVVIKDFEGNSTIAGVPAVDKKR